jgi:hypothetical protein
MSSELKDFVNEPAHSPFSYPPIKRHPGKLVAVTVIFNPHRFLVRYRLYRTFEKQMRDLGITLITVEIAMGGRPFEVTSECDEHHIQLTTREEIWQKERALNLGFQRAILLYPHCERLMWIDADTSFTRHDLGNEILHMLEHYPVVQVFAQAVNLGPRGEVTWTCNGFAKSYASNPHPTDFTGNPGSYGTPGGHPGLGWAFRRDALDAMGCLFDTAIAGSGDLHMAAAWIGNPLHGSHGGRLTEAYRRSLLIWGERADKVVKRHIGYVDGACFHHWHGKSTQRGYLERWEILLKYQFDPYKDIFLDVEGLWQISQDKRALAHELKASLSLRNEDSIDL